MCEWCGNLPVNRAHMWAGRTKSGTHTHAHTQKEGRGGALITCPVRISLLPQFLISEKDTVVRNESSSWETDVWKNTCVMQQLSPLGPPRVNEPPHKFHSSQALMSCCSLSITPTGEHLSRPSLCQTATLQQRRLLGAQRRQNDCWC